MEKELNIDYHLLTGYIRVAACVPEVRIADVAHNVESIAALAARAAEAGARIAVFPELCITAYTCGDLFLQNFLQEKAIEGLADLAGATSELDMVIIAGAPLRHRNRLYNCAAVIYKGEILGIVPKSHIPNYAEFYEKRWFAPGIGDSASPAGADADEISMGGCRIPFATDMLFQAFGATFGIEICEDLWVPVPPSCRLATSGADIIFNLSASDETIGKHDYLLSLIRQQSARCRCGYVYASAGVGESSTDLVFAGNAIIAEDGSLLRQSPRFRREALMETADIDMEKLRGDRIKYNTFTDSVSSPMRTIVIPTQGPETVMPPLQRYVDAHPFVPADSMRLKSHCDDIIAMQAWGLAQRFGATGCRKAVIGISGGLDSTLALLVTAKAFDMLGLERSGIIAVTMPGLATTTRTHSNALELMRLLGATSLEIGINKAVAQHFSDIGQDPAIHDATYENSQARERTQILMDLANKYSGMVVGTGDLSELALGWCTYNGDQMSMYGVNASIPKTLVKYLVSHVAAESEPAVRRVLDDIVDTPISPELVPAQEGDVIAQKTEDLVGPYELHDFFIYNMLRNGYRPAKTFALACIAFEGIYDPETVKHWLKTFCRRFFNQQFKRSCMPDGPKVGSVCLSPRGDWRMPSDASSRMWLDEVERL